MTRPALVISSLLVGCTLVLGLVASANYSGMCIAELRYLSDAEKVRAAVSFAMDSGWLPKTGQVFGQRYESLEQYLQLPGCCVVALDFVGRPSLRDRVLGRLAGYVSILKDDDSFARQHFREIFPAVSNCGRGWDWQN